jgi:hypothetical protein
MYTTGFGAQDGVNLGTAVRVPREGPVERRRRTWTHSSAEGSTEGAHAVEFSKTVAPLLERWLLSTWGALGRPNRLRPPRRTDEYSAENRPCGGAASQILAAAGPWYSARRTRDLARPELLEPPLRTPSGRPLALPLDPIGCTSLTYTGRWSAMWSSSTRPRLSCRLHPGLVVRLGGGAGGSRCRRNPQPEEA